MALKNEKLDLRKKKNNQNKKIAKEDQYTDQDVHNYLKSNTVHNSLDVKLYN